MPGPLVVVQADRVSKGQMQELGLRSRTPSLVVRASDKEPPNSKKDEMVPLDSNIAKGPGHRHDILLGTPLVTILPKDVHKVTGVHLPHADAVMPHCDAACPMPTQHAPSQCPMSHAEAACSALIQRTPPG